MAYLKIDFDAYKNNVEFVGNKVGGTDRLLVVLKDNAYGHGIEQIAPLAAALGIKKAVVKDLQEAKRCEAFFDEVLILIEARIENAIVSDKISYSVCDLAALHRFPSDVSIHLAIDTNMRRHGVMPNEIEDALKLIKEKNLKLKGIFTHFYAADMSGDLFEKQNKIWHEAKAVAKNMLAKYGFNDVIFHSKASAATLRSTDYEDEFCRLGISAYGYADMDKDLGEFPLKPVLSLWGERISTRTLKAGETLGYGGVYKAPQDMIVSTYDIGYGDGFFRSNGKRELKIANGQEILGRICMDCFSVEGDADEICIFNDVTELAKHFDTISYEIITKMSPYLKRVVTKLTPEL